MGDRRNFFARMYLLAIFQQKKHFLKDVVF